MFKNVLVGVDGRPAGQDAIALARRLTDPAGKLTLCHVLPGAAHPLHAVRPGVVHEERDASQALLEQALAAGEVSAELVSVEAGSPGAGLHRQSEKQGSDLLVVGSCHRGALGRAMIGDDTRAALNGAPCAVAIAARGYDEHPIPLSSIGVAYNGSPESRAALERARTIAAPTHAQLKVLEVVAIPTYAFTGLVPPAIGETVDLMLTEANERVHALGDDVEGRAVYGLAGEELAEFGDDVDLLVVGSRGYGPMRRLVIGSTSEHLQRHARCSLLVLPRGEEPAQNG